MFHVKAAFTVALTILLCATGAMANIYIVPDDPPEDKYIDKNISTYQQTLSFGLSPGEVIDSARLVFYLYDDNDPQAEKAYIYLDGNLKEENVTSLSTKNNPTIVTYDVYNYVQDKKITFKIEGQNSTGKVDDFYYDKAVLTVTTHVVPLPGSVLLLGSGLLGTALVYRRRRGKKAA
jgi:hypothetical protein